MTPEILIALAGFALVGSITPGPNNLMLMTSGINYGWSRTIPHMMGVSVGFTLMLFLIGIGLTQIFEIFPVLYQILKVVSIVYLSYLAWKIATTSTAAKNSEDPSTTRKPMTFLQAALFQWVNPKAWVFGVSAISTYTAAIDAPYAVLIITAIYFLVCIPSVSVWTILGVQLQRILNNPTKLRVFNITAAVLLMASLYPVLFY